MGIAPGWRVCGVAGPRPSSIGTAQQDLYPRHADSCQDPLNEDAGVTEYDIAETEQSICAAMGEDCGDATAKREPKDGSAKAPR